MIQKVYRQKGGVKNPESCKTHEYLSVCPECYCDLVDLLKTVYDECASAHSWGGISQRTRDMLLHIQIKG